MAYRVEWSPRAVEDLEAIAQYIALDSTAYSSAVVKTILQTTRNFSRFPLSGRIVPSSETKAFGNGSRIVIESYRIDESIITIAAIVHGKRVLKVQ